MNPAFNNEAILQGSIDHLCLVCERHLRTDREVCHHISTSAHRENLASTDYVEKYRNDRIRKVKKWYFCEFCNILVFTIVKVRLHVEELRHKENIASQLIARVNDAIISRNIAISDDAWNGFIDENTCTVCNVEFEEQDAHKRESAHIINLIQSKIIIDFNNIYRKIDDHIFQCLTCNTVVSEINAHLDENEHRNIIQKCTKILPGEDGKEKNVPKTCTPQAVNEIKLIDDKNKVNKIDNEASVSVNIVGTDASVKVKLDVQNKNETIEKDTKTYIVCGLDGITSCNLCKWNFNPLEIKKHLDSSHHQNMLKKDSSEKCNTNDDADDNDNTSKILDSIQKFQHENININLETRTARCRKCSAELEFDFQAIDTHVEQHNNNNNVEKKQTNGTTTTGSEKDANKVCETETLVGSSESQHIEQTNEGNVERKPTEMTQKNEDEIIRKMAEEHDMTYTHNKLYCQKCNKHIAKSITSIEEHVKGELHRNVLLSSKHLKENDNKKINKKKYTMKKITLHQFIRMIMKIKNTISEDVVLNQKYCINIMAFTFLTATAPGRLRCQVCEVNLSSEHMVEHINVMSHEKILNDVLVIIRTDSEFIRELRNGIFQCGYCNIFNSWEEIQNHLKTTDHVESKNSANWRLSQYLPEIRKYQRNTPSTRV